MITDENIEACMRSLTSAIEGSGVTLRDRFAMAALVTFVQFAEVPAEKIADGCYEIADAMMLRREQKPAK